MGIISQGILGGISGKVGNVIGATWKGIHYVRIKPASVANPRTELQVNQRNRFSATVAFVQPSLAFVQVGYKFLAKKMSAYNAATSYVVQNAITGTAPDFQVDYPNALVSRGKLTRPGTTGTTMASGNATVTWANNSLEGNARPDDKAMLLVYNPAKSESVVALETGATRMSTSQLVELPAYFLGDTVEIYLAFQSADGSMVSDSTHVGSEVVV